jgi:hypothetical protein
VIYFVQRPSGGPIKIGTTTDLSQRLPALTCQYKTKLTVLAIMDGHHSVEASLHKQFHRLNVQDEWFDPAPKLLSFIKRHGRQWDGLENDRPASHKKTRRCTVILDETLWDRLKQIEEETGAGPSFTARRILGEALFDTMSTDQPQEA